MIEYRVESDPTKFQVALDPNTTCDEFLAAVQKERKRNDLVQVWIDGSVVDGDDILYDFLDEDTKVVVSSSNWTMKRVWFGKKVEATLFTNDSIASMRIGDKITVSLSATRDDLVRSIIPHFKKTWKEGMIIDIYLPGGILFKSGTLESRMMKCKYMNLYAIAHLDIDDLDLPVNPHFIIQESAKIAVFSPLYNRVKGSVSKMWGFLNLVQLRLKTCYDLINNLAANYRFAPMIIALRKIFDGVIINYRDVIAVTASLQTIIAEMVGTDDFLDYTLHCLSIIGTKLMGTSVEYLMADYLWRPDFEDVSVRPMFYVELGRDEIMSIFNTNWFLFPVTQYSVFRMTPPFLFQCNGSVHVCLYYNGFKCQMKITKGPSLLHVFNPFERLRNAEESHLQIHLQKVNQIIVVCIEKTSRMQELDHLVREFSESYENEFCRFRTSTIYALAKYSNKMSLVVPFQTINEDFSEILKCIPYAGETSPVYDTISQCIDALYAFGTTERGIYYKQAKFRVIMVTAGDDDGSQTSHEELVNKLIESNVILDTVVLKPAKVSALAKCCHLSGGSIVVADDTDKIKAVARSEAFLSIGLREIIPSESESIDHHFPNRMTNQGEEKVKMITAIEAARQTINLEKFTNREQRIIRELREAAKFADPNIHVYASDKIDQWRIFMKGVDGTPYAGKWFYLVAIFPAGYPRDHPLFKFISIPFHINISSEGRICLNFLDKEYTSGAPVISLILCIRMLLSEPNYDDPIDSSHIEFYKRDPVAFERKCYEDTAKFGKDSPEDWLSELNDK